MSIKSDIAGAIKSKLEELVPTDLKLVVFERVRLHSDDFSDHELPAVQLFDGSESVLHDRGRANKAWTIHLELLMKSSEKGKVVQTDLWDLQFLVERKLWERPNLGISGMQHLRYLGSVTDLHMMEPIYMCRMDFEALYFQPLTASC